jgi:hypothetical protein
MAPLESRRATADAVGIEEARPDRAFGHGAVVDLGRDRVVTVLDEPAAGAPARTIRAVRAGAPRARVPAGRGACA